jgi:hypothetical protein
MSANALIAIVLGVRLWQEYKRKPQWSGNRPTRQTRDGSFTFCRMAPSEWLKYCARIPQERQNRTSASRPTANARYQIASFVRVSVIGTQSINRERVSPSMVWPYFLGGRIWGFMLAEILCWEHILDDSSMAICTWGNALEVKAQSTYGRTVHIPRGTLSLCIL